MINISKNSYMIQKSNEFRDSRTEEYIITFESPRIIERQLVTFLAIREANTTQNEKSLPKLISSTFILSWTANKTLACGVLQQIDDPYIEMGSILIVNRESQFIKGKSLCESSASFPQALESNRETRSFLTYTYTNSF